MVQVSGPLVPMRVPMVQVSGPLVLVSGSDGASQRAAGAGERFRGCKSADGWCGCGVPLVQVRGRLMLVGGLAVQVRGPSMRVSAALHHRRGHAYQNPEVQIPRYARDDTCRARDDTCRG